MGIAIKWLGKLPYKEQVKILEHIQKLVKLEKILSSEIEEEEYVLSEIDDMDAAEGTSSVPIEINGKKYFIHKQVLHLIESLHKQLEKRMPQSKVIKGVRHYIYDTREEFREKYPVTPLVKDWRKGREGDWVLSDDGRIIQLLKVSKNLHHPKDSKNYSSNNGYVRTIVGTFISSAKTHMDTDFAKHPIDTHFHKKLRIQTKELNNARSVQIKKIFATSVAVGKDAVSAYMKAFTEKNRNTARKKAVILLKQERVMSEIEKTSKEVAKELGIDHAYILGSLKQLADTSEDQNIALQSIKELGKAIGTLGNQVKKVETGVVGLFQGFSPDEIEGAQRKILPETTKED